MQYEEVKTAVVAALHARLAMDADLGVEHVAGCGDAFAHFDALSAGPGKKASSGRYPARRVDQAATYGARQQETQAAAATDYPREGGAASRISTPSSASDMEEDRGVGRRMSSENDPPRQEYAQKPSSSVLHHESLAASPENDANVASGRSAAAPAGHLSLVPLTEAPPNPEKEAALADLRGECMTCMACELCQRRKRVVWGEGSLDARVMFIGEGPGRDEDLEARPFVGRSGRLLTDIIEKGMKIPRCHVYIANVVKCRPPGNRDPKPEEVAACSRYLHRQIEVIRPFVIVAVGMVAARALLGVPPGTAGLRRHWHEYAGIPMRVMFHPSYLLRQRQFETHRTEADVETWKDVQEVMKKMGDG